MALPVVKKGWKLKDIGYDEHDIGTIHFLKCGSRRTRAIPLMAWPTTRPEMSAPRPYTAAPTKAPTHPKPTAPRDPPPHTRHSPADATLVKPTDLA